jgi:hypothetical protein
MARIRAVNTTSGGFGRARNVITCQQIIGLFTANDLLAIPVKMRLVAMIFIDKKHFFS